MPYYQPERPLIRRQYSGDSERTDHLLVKHQNNPSNYDNNSTEDDIFSGRHHDVIKQSGTMGSRRSKSTPITVEESLSGEYQQYDVPGQPSMSYDDDGASYDPHEVGAHRGGASRGGNSYHSFQQGDYSYSGSYQERDFPPEEQEYYRDQYFEQQHEGRSYTDEGELYYGEDQEEYEQRQSYHDDGHTYEEQRRHPPYGRRGYKQGHPQGHHPNDYPDEYDQQYPEDYDEYYHGHPDEYGDYHQGHCEEYLEVNSQDYSGYRHKIHQQGYTRGQYRDWPQPEDEYSHLDDQEESYISHNQERHYSSYEARRNAEGHWEESSEIDGGTISSKTLNTNLEGMKYIPKEPYDNSYYGGEETAFDYSEGPSNERSESPEIPFNGASTLASPLHDDEGSQGSASVWEGVNLRNRSLMDNPVSPLSQTQFTIGERTDYTGETRSTRRPVSKFIQRTKRQVGGCAGVTYDNGEFQVRTDSSKRSNRSKSKRGESATILDIMFSVGHDLIMGTKDKRSKSRRRRDPAAKIVDSFKEMFSCGVEEEQVDDYDDYESYRS